MNAVALVCIVASGTALPLMDIVFGDFINVYNDFSQGSLSADAYRSEVARYSYACSRDASGRVGLTLMQCRLFFVYIFIAKFSLTYVWTVWLRPPSSDICFPR